MLQLFYYLVKNVYIQYVIKLIGDILVQKYELLG